ncbi:MAG: methyltransferase domain-containing protein [Pseudomonadota bacterium]|nr:methyltransferase domain-containing protein [Pseudomonadota bacterium]
MAKIAFKDRFKAWWEGYDPASVPQPRKRRVTEDTVAQKRSCPHGPEAETLHLLFGNGYHRPGGPDLLFSMLQRCDLKAGHNTLVLGCGTGGICRDLVERYRVSVTGMEPNRALAEVGAEMAHEWDLGQQARIGAVDLVHVELSAQRHHLVLAPLELHLIEDRYAIYRTIEKSLRKRGVFAFSQYIAANDADGVALANSLVSQIEPEIPPLLHERDEMRKLVDAGMEPFLAEDFTDAVLKATIEVFAGWQRAVEAMSDYAEQPRMLQELVRIVEHWQKRTDAIKAGKLRVCLFYAAKNQNELF